MIDYDDKVITLSEIEQHIEIHKTQNGCNNSVYIKGRLSKSCKIKLIFTGSNSSVFIGEECNYRGTIRVDSAGVIKIGDNFKATNNISMLCRPQKSITIGNNVLFASNIVVRTSDEHSIFDKNTSELLNPNKDVVIGDRVWCCDNVIILKGSNIGNDSVIGAGSIVSGVIINNVVAAGNPCRIIKKDIVWSYDKPK